MKPATLNDPEEGQPLLADPPTSRRTMNAPIEDAINGEFTTLIDDYNLDTCGSS